MSNKSLCIFWSHHFWTVLPIVEHDFTLNSDFMSGADDIANLWDIWVFVYSHNSHQTQKQALKLQWRILLPLWSTYFAILEAIHKQREEVSTCSFTALSECWVCITPVNHLIKCKNYELVYQLPYKMFLLYCMVLLKNKWNEYNLFFSICVDWKCKPEILFEVCRKRCFLHWFFWLLCVILVD